MTDPNSQVFFDPWEERGHSHEPAAEKTAISRAGSHCNACATDDEPAIDRLEPPWLGLVWLAFGAVSIGIWIVLGYLVLAILP